MKKTLILLIGVAFIVGCGSNDSAKEKFMGKTESRDYIADGMNYLAKAEVPKAIASFDMAIRQDPTNVSNYLVLGQVYFKLKNYARATDTFAAALRIEPNNGEIYYLIATATAIDGKKEDAIKAAQKSVDAFIASKDQEKLKKSLVLLKSLVDSGNEGDTTQSAQAIAAEQL